MLNLTKTRKMQEKLPLIKHLVPTGTFAFLSGRQTVPMFLSKGMGRFSLRRAISLSYADGMLYFSCLMILLTPMDVSVPSATQKSCSPTLRGNKYYKIAF